MIIIPIGVDCGLADYLKKYNLRKFSLPFDWTVTYHGVSKCIADDFTNFIPKRTERINDYGVFFYHDFSINTYESDKIKYNRRILRTKNLLESANEPVIFVRKGHAYHHHNEHHPRFVSIKNDIDDAEDLDKVISRKYKDLSYRIIVILACGACFDPKKTYTSTSNKIDIYNIASMVIDNSSFDTCFANIVDKLS